MMFFGEQSTLEFTYQNHLKNEFLLDININ